MNRLYVLCVITLVAILVDVMLFHPKTASAQYTSYTVEPVPIGQPFDLKNAAVVGFSCVTVRVGPESPDRTQCYAMKG